MAKNFYRSIFVVVMLMGFTIIGIDTVNTFKLNNSNTALVLGIYEKIEQREYRGDYSYYIYLHGNGKRFYIGASQAECFDYNRFKADVKLNSEICLRIPERDNLLLPEDQASVVNIDVTHTNYMSLACVRKQAKKRLLWLAITPFICISAMYLLYKQGWLL